MPAELLRPKGDLAGITVIALEQAVAAPYASALLAAAGARVIKVEREEGDFARRYDRHVLGQSSYFVWLNAGKQSICLDLAAAGDRELLGRMIASADVLIQNLKPGTLEKWGLASTTLREAHPRLITCDVTGFGSQGPSAALKAYDLIVQAEIGLCAITGGADGPARVGISVCDIAAGVTAHAAILQALYARSQTGRGRGIAVSLFDSLAQWMSVPLLQHLHGGQNLPRAGVSHPTIAPYGAFGCRDGAQLILSVQNEREWAAFCAIFLGRSELATDPRFIDVATRVRNRPALDGLIADRFATMTEDEAMAALARSGIAHGRLNDLAGAARHPHLRFETVETPAGRAEVIARAPIVTDAVPALGPLPRCGEHGAALRAEFTVAAEEVHP